MTNPLYDALFAPHRDVEKAFIKDPITGFSLSYKDFTANSSQMAAALQAQGLKPGDRLAAQVGKSITSLNLYAACVQAGLVYLPLNTAYTANELDYFVGDSGASMIVGDPDKASELKKLASSHNAQLLTLSADGNAGTLIDTIKTCTSPVTPVQRDGDDLAAFLYTSGTTGRSKGAMLTHNNLLSNSESLVSLWQFSADDVLLHALPVFHTHGLFVALNVTLRAQSSLIFESGFNLDRMLERLPSATCLMGVPTFYTRLLGDNRFDKALTENIRLFVSGSAPLLAETHHEFEERTGHRILERYGMTETNMNTSNPYDGDRRAGTVGMPLPGVEVKVTDMQTGHTLPNGEIGVLEVRGPNVFKGYWNMPEKTAEELRENGFFITGDLGIIDDDGYVSIVGRNKDLIISGGYNIYPKEIEQVLDDQSGVLESAVIGVPHKDFGETVVGVLVADGKTLDLDAVQSAIEESLARYKHPRKLIVAEELPRNTMGKVQKNLLRDEYGQLFV